MVKQTAQLDSGRRIGVSALLQEVLMVDRGPASQDSKKGAKIKKIGPDFLYICTTRGATVKQMAPVDSTYAIGLTTLLTDVLTVDEGVRGW